MPKTKSSAALTPKLTRIARLKQFQADRGLRGPAELGRAIGRNTNQTSDLLRGRASFGERIARAIEQFAGLPVGWLDQPALETRGAVESPARLGTTDRQIVSAYPLGGAAGTQQPVCAPLLLAGDWVGAVLASTGPQLHYLHMPDDSMAPLLARGDLLLVDSGVRAFGRDGVYVLRAGERLLVRYLRARLDGLTEVSAGSAAGGTNEIASAGSLRVVGQAVWVWRGQQL
ncbi:helix-turn-helix transcriptional regulator [Ramlibacter henchirensis]|uniref:Helix-turn-helix transcriptional regulator n=1 Tax=Ramlibacter henchirensis TaxID=204072 RepID=A0A4Z0BX65_9BURK|nr:S24 family peptidase [Ramlibacter henchirensis]TFZ03094.1 helix-turn-helix transcriptional regulator [Ramlibacter henchirensis]